MVRTIQHIERDLAALEESAQTLAQEFQAAYREYLAILAVSVRQQLILAAYHLCTQGYPEQFLQLSVSQRQKLLDGLKALTRNAQTELGEISELDPSNLEQAIAALEEGEREEGESKDDFGELEVVLPDDASLGEEWLRNALQQKAEASLPADEMTFSQRLLSWRDLVETKILKVLQNLSQGANHLLYQENIVPSNLPEQVLEAAAKADLSAEVTGSSPNLLNLMIEAKSKDEEAAEVTRLVTIRLRLSEIEFSDVTLTSLRSQLRALAARLTQLERNFRKRQREMAIAQAEAAWRALWFED